MSDIRGAEGNDGNSGFASEWQRLARAEDGQADQAPQDSEARHESGLDDAPRGQEATPPIVEAAPQPAPAEDADDIWANAPEALRNAYRAEREAREAAEREARTNGGRASKAAREAAELRARLTAPPQAQAPQQQEEAPKVPDRLKGVLEEYEDIAKPFVEEIGELRQSLARLERAGASATEQQAARDQLELTQFLADEEQKLADAHADWKEVVVQPDFVNWVQSGPQFIRDGIARNGNGIVDGNEAASILNLYKGQGVSGGSDPLAARRARQLEGGRAVPARTPGATPSGNADDFTSEWARLKAEDERRRERQLATR